MPMQRFRLGMTQRFLLFFFLTAVIPMVVIGSLLLRQVQEDLNGKRLTVVQTGRQLAKTIFLSDMEQLNLEASQAAFIWAAQSYELLRATGNAQPLETQLNRLQQSKDLDIVALMNRHGRIIARSRLFGQDVSSPSFNALIHTALAGNLVSSIEQFQIFGSKLKHSTLYYIAAVPIQSTQDSRSILGVLVLGQALEKEFSYQQLTRTLPDLEVRIFQSTNAPNRVVFDSMGGRHDSGEGVDVIPPPLTPHPVDERIRGHLYKSLTSPIINFLKEPIGEVVVSTPALEETDFDYTSLYWTGFYLLFSLFCIAGSGFWFHRTFVRPVESIAHASSDVSSGDLSVSVSEKGTQAEMRQTVRNFNRMIRRLEEDESLRNTFIATLTHDLRTPLLAESRLIELFEEFASELPPQFAKLTQNLGESNEHLLKMVNSLLETFKYEAGRETLLFEATQLRQIVEASFSKLLPLAQSNHIMLSCDIPTDFPPLEADPAQLERVFINLIGNAVENIHPTGDRVQVSAEMPEGQAAQAQMVEIRIRDNGPGIPAAMLPNLFERYAIGYRAQKIGSGLGLYICKMIIERHRGKIDVTSQEGQGTVFHIRLPVRVPDEGNSA